MNKKINNETFHPLFYYLRYENSIHLFSISFNLNKFAYLKDYCIFGHNFIAGSTFIEIALSALDFLYYGKTIIIKDMKILSAVSLHKKLDYQLELRITDNGMIHFYDFDENNHKQLKVQMFYFDKNMPAKTQIKSITKLKSMAYFCHKQGHDYYENMLPYKINYGPSFRRLIDFQIGKEYAFGSFAENSDTDYYFFHPTLLYGAFQLFTAMLAELSLRHGKLYFPMHIGQIIGFQVKKPARFAFVQGIFFADELTAADIYLLDQQGQTIVKIKNFGILASDPNSLLIKVLKTEIKNDSFIQKITGDIQQILQNLVDQSISYNAQFSGVCFLIYLWAARILEVFTSSE